MRHGNRMKVKVIPGKMQHLPRGIKHGEFIRNDTEGMLCKEHKKILTDNHGAVGLAEELAEL
ncbi:Hexokinase-2 [Manis pentadactyla]|nr:Hexokinase-2 [Manis pentadactyla]